MSTDRLFTPTQRRFVTAVVAGVLGLLALGVAVALLAYPSWRLALAAICVLAALPIAVVEVRTAPAPFRPGVPASAYVRSAALGLGVLALVALGGWLLSTSPTV